MSPLLLRRLAIVDVLGVPLLVLAYVWVLQFAAPQVWVLFPVWLGVSFVLHRDTPRTLGWRADNLGPATRQAAVALGLSAGLLVAIGLALGVPNKWAPHLFSMDRLWRYFAFCVLQQVALQSFLNNRLMAIVPSRRLSSLLAGAIFSVLHWPNPVLVPVTFLGGSLLAWLFARERNIIPLAIAQAILGSLAWWAFPQAWHHSLRVGPGYDQPFGPGR